MKIHHLVTFVLILLLIGIGYVSVNEYYMNEDSKTDSIMDISTQDLKTITDGVSTDSDLFICSMKTDECILLKKIGDNNG